MLKWIHKYENGTHYYDCPVCDDGYVTEHPGAPSAFCHRCGTKLAEMDVDTKAKVLKSIPEQDAYVHQQSILDTIDHMKSGYHDHAMVSAIGMLDVVRAIVRTAPYLRVNKNGDLTDAESDFREMQNALFSSMAVPASVIGSQKTFLDAIRGFSDGEMLAFLEMIASAELETAFCSSYCHRKEDDCQECSFPQSGYISALLSSPMQPEEETKIREKGREYDSKNSNGIL